MWRYSIIFETFHKLLRSISEYVLLRSLFYSWFLKIMFHLCVCDISTKICPEFIFLSCLFFCKLSSVINHLIFQLICQTVTWLICLLICSEKQCGFTQSVDVDSFERTRNINLSQSQITSPWSVLMGLKQNPKQWLHSTLHLKRFLNKR